MEILNKIQKDLKVPKTQKNAFGGYNYRTCGDILEAVKPLLNGAVLTLTDEIIYIASTPTQQFQSPLAKDKQYDVDGSRFYVKATATIKLGTESQSVSAFAREPLNKKGMDESQITGTASSYARKYALSGLFCIDDSVLDPDNDKPLKDEPKIKDITPTEQRAIDDIYNKILDTASEQGLSPDKNSIKAYSYAKTKLYPETKEQVDKFIAHLLTGKNLMQVCKPLKKTT
ncbi:MAG: ERF family protein [Candidatus Micrarchaeia archaeon]|jgi:hypothetical protein